MKRYNILQGALQIKILSIENIVPLAFETFSCYPYSQNKCKNLNNEQFIENYKISKKIMTEAATGGVL